MDVKGQAALVLGGASGIGLVTAKELLRAGINVAVGDISKSIGEEIGKKLQQEFGATRIIFLHVDVTKHSQLEAAFDETKNHFKRIDILVNCAGLVFEDNWSYAVDVNLKGTIDGTLLAWKHMAKNEGGPGGVVVNVASILGLMPSGGVPVYTATKHAVVGWGRSTGNPFNFERTGVRILTICPGVTDTPLIEDREGLRCFTKAHTVEMDRELNSFPMQKADDVGSGILHMIKYGDSGSIWVSNGGEPVYEVDIPFFEDIKKA